MIAKILRWSARALLVIVLVAVAAVVAFRLAAVNRETGERDVLAPASGRLVQTSSGFLMWRQSVSYRRIIPS